MTLDIITSRALHPLRHGFFTRKGGASSGVFAGLNCGYGSSDMPEVVGINRARVAKAMEVPADAIRTLNQVHSATVVTAPFDGTPAADAMVTNRPGVVLSILTADCQPVLLADAKAGVIGAAHAGWKGAIGGVLEATVQAMRDLGATDISAVIGPCISQRAYEVGPEMLDTFLAEDDAYARFFAQGQGDRLLFDLPGFGLSRLRAAGAEAEWTGHCTYSDPDRFYSFRRTTHAKEADYGRLIATIRL
ncbi:peptidoglycan editing factor PgeF [Falsirhodobacter sp. 20TX0035]|uniref:peptidoglycan editing factor PgeF n=1 Tax=Falsirhodobacter sp. 20TX0035 TaxID=3022019 RepID=UPI00232FBFCF|nr:peptidoglycan editing factor PgeF [Falsirhodobacter sp. 20TX0035]MDB6453791.1 peptidoglycan editing factor PgeF [Falsirhodobacter sp. 20TX0035]